MNLYVEQIVDLAKHPLNKRIIENADITRSGANPVCGDHVRIYVKLDGETVRDASFQGDGCAIHTAASSLLTEEIKGMPLGEIGALTTETMFALLGTAVGPARVKCAVLSLETLQEGLKPASAGCPRSGPERAASEESGSAGALRASSIK